MDCSPSGSSVRGISQAKKLEWDAISFSNAKKYTAISKKEVGVYITWIVIQDLYPDGGEQKQIAEPLHTVHYNLLKWT